MRIFSLFVFTILMVFLFSCSVNQRPDTHENIGYIGSLTNVQIDSLLKENVARNLTITERMKIYSEYFLGTPWDFTCVGDGEYALLEPYPLVNFSKTNCMALCEHVLALSISDSWDNFFNNLQHIRYKDGIIGMRTRNHYTMADWLPGNNWLLMDASRLVGGNYTRQMTRIISHREFFRKKGITDLRYVKPDRKITIDYIPTQYLNSVIENLKSGDILALLFANKTDIFSAHMLMVFDNHGEKFIRESSNSKMTTFDTPISEWVDRIIPRERYAGIAVMRVKSSLNTKGKVILPWQICEMQNEQN